MTERLSLDGVWDFFPGDAEEPAPIRVPGLWEAQGWPDLDGVARYRRRFEVDDADGWWSLRFGAVMDFADVSLNGVRVGSHEGAFTPFELDVTRALARGENVLDVRVRDLAVGDPEHARTPHGKQGWANHVFPSPPSLYRTYGGIWQPVALLRHGPVVARDVFVNGDPDDLAVALDLCNRSRERRRASVRLETLGAARELDAELAPGERRTLSARFGRADAACWTPDAPVLYTLRLRVGDDEETVRYGLRTVRVEGRRLLLNGEPYRMRSALVQGFRADTLYAEPGRAAIREEVLAARAMGFDTLRLHVKPFDPAYLDVCDELGMLLHCDLPVAEPVDYGQLGADTVLARRCLAAAREQVRRDRNHPSVVLWTAMNEIGERRRDARLSPGYEAFARALHDAVRESDPTRPVIENDWMEPDPERVFRSPILTAHWYGRLHRDWLDRLERMTAGTAGVGRPFLVSELGDWGLPEPALCEPWVEALERTPWPGSAERFVAETQRYQGLSDRLQIEVLRRHDHVGGYCVTELTDVPQELNGLLDVERRPKGPAAEEMRRANQRVLPMLDFRTLTVAAGETVVVPLHVANDGPALSGVEVEVGGALIRVGDLPAHRATSLGEVALEAPAAPGSHQLAVRLLAAGGPVAENAYPLNVVEAGGAPVAVRVLGGGPTAEALAALGSRPGDGGPTVVAEDALDAALAPEVRARLERGETVLVLAQPWESARHYPVTVALEPVETRWGTGFVFATGGVLSALPQDRVLAGEDATVHARAIVTEVAGDSFPERPLVVRFNPRGTTGSIAGAHGGLVFCQYPLARRALAGDPLSRALLADLVHLVALREPAAAGTSGP